jgi:hypothetical protein
VRDRRRAPHRQERDQARPCHDPKRIMTPVVNQTRHTCHSTLRIPCEAFQIETDDVDFRCEGGSSKKHGAAVVSLIGLQRRWPVLRTLLTPKGCDRSGRGLRHQRGFCPKFPRCQFWNCPRHQFGRQRQHRVVSSRTPIPVESERDTFTPIWENATTSESCWTQAS